MIRYVLIIMALALTSCLPEYTKWNLAARPPVVQTGIPDLLPLDSIRLNGFFYDGESEVLEAGFFIATDTAQRGNKFNTAISDTFNLVLNKPPDSNYLFRAFALNEKGVGYGYWRPVRPNFAQGFVDSLLCDEIIISGMLTEGLPAQDVFVRVPYQGGNGGLYPSISINSTDIQGISLGINSGQLSSDTGSLIFQITGTPNRNGVANFNLNIGTKSCLVAIMVQEANIPPRVTSLLCDSASHTGILLSGTSSSGVISYIPYKGGNGRLFPTYSFNSVGVSGLTATVDSGRLQIGDGGMVVKITGIPDGPGVARFNINFGGVQCVLLRNVAVLDTTGYISSLDCANPTNNGILVNGVTATGVSSTLSYTGGNGRSYSIFSVNSTGVSGLIATILPGVFSSGNGGTILVMITGTPTNSGLANFAINIGGQSCTLSRVVVPSLVASLDCNNAQNNGAIFVGVPAIGASISIPYVGGNGGPYQSQMINSTGVTGLSANLPAGNFNTGSGFLTYNITGTASSIGAAVFQLNIGGQSCNVSRQAVNGNIATLDCTGSALFGSLVGGRPASNVTVSLPYQGGNGGPFSAFNTASTGVTV